MKYNKIFVATLLVLMLLTSMASAAKPIVTADNTYFDINTGLYHLNGNVYIKTGNRTITADQARVNPNALEVWGTGNITVKQDDIIFTGSSVYVYGSKKLAKIDGGVNLSRNGLAISADRVEFSWGSKIAIFTGIVRVTQGNTNWTADSASYDIKQNRFL